MEAVAPGAFKDDLDLLAGIDAWQVLRTRSAIRGIASRVQWGRDFRSFTVRLSRASGQKTEYAKRLDAIRNKSEGFLFPHLTVQAFLDKESDRLCSVAAIPTELLILQIEKLFLWNKLRDGKDWRFGVRQLPDGTEFVYLAWDYILCTELRAALAICENAL